MSVLTLNDCIKFVNLTKSTIVSEFPWREAKGKWSIHEGKHKIHQDEYPFKLIYLTTNISLLDFDRIFKEVHPIEKIHLLYPDSNKPLIDKSSGLLKKFTRLTGFTPKDYILSFISSEIEFYKTTIKQIDTKFYIDPNIKTPSSFKVKFPNALRQFVNDNDKDVFGKVGILQAEPGQGKTFLCQYVAKDTIASKSYVPLLIQSNQWTGMAVDDLKSISKTIINSLKYFGANIAWAYDSEDDFIRITLKADIFRLIFDGFDEYILKNSFSEKPEEVLGYLIDLAKNSGARIAITTRSSFWSANIDYSNFNNDLIIYELLPFDANHARSYFDKRISLETKKRFANEVFRTLTEKNKEITGRGFVLSLIAELAEKSINDKVEDAKTIKWLLTAFCEREQERQKLPINKSEQIELLKELSIENASGLFPNDDEFGILIDSCKKELDSETIKSVIAKLKSHPLIENTGSGWRFKNEQVFYYIIAIKVYYELSNKSSNLLNLIMKISLKEKNFLANVCDWVVEIAFEEHDTFDLYVDFLKESNNMLQSKIAIFDGGPKRNDSFSLFIASLLIISIEKQHKNSSRQQRTEFLHSVCGESISRLIFWGTLSNFDFSRSIFEDCKFENLHWAKCRFGENTKFKNCSFQSCIPVENCENFHLAVFEKCRMDNEFQFRINSLLISKGKRDYTKEDLSAEIKILASKFITKNGIPSMTVERNNFENRGNIIKSRYRKDIIDAFSEFLLERINISQAEDGGYKVFKQFYEDFTFLHNNNMLVGGLREVYDRLCEKLKLP